MIRNEKGFKFCLIFCHNIQEKKTIAQSNKNLPKILNVSELGVLEKQWQ